MSDVVIKKFDLEMSKVEELTGIRRARFPVIDVHTHLGQSRLGKNYKHKYDVRDYLNKLVKMNVRHVANMDGMVKEDFDQMLSFTKNHRHFITTFMSLDFSNFGLKSFEDEVTTYILACYHKGSRGIRLEYESSSLFMDSKGILVRLDDERLKFIYRLAKKFDMPVYLSVSPSEKTNKVKSRSAFEDLLTMQENVIKTNKQTKFIVGQFASCVKDLNYVAHQLDLYSNMFIDIAGCVYELGRVPYSARRFFIKYQNRILFGSNSSPLNDSEYEVAFRFLETFDECFEYHEQGQWYIYGIELPNRVLKKIYFQNASLLLKIPNELLLLNERIMKD